MADSKPTRPGPFGIPIAETVDPSLRMREGDIVLGGPLIPERNTANDAPALWLGGHTWQEGAAWYAAAGALTPDEPGDAKILMELRGLGMPTRDEAKAAVECAATRLNCGVNWFGDLVRGVPTPAQ